MSSKEKRSLGGSALLVLAVLFLALTVLNSIVFRGIRLDLTENKLYTISDGTENILAKIEEPLNLYYFYSDRATENIPYLRTYAKRVRELLQELALKSNGRVRLAELDPLPFSEEEDRASQYGLQAVTLGAGSDPIYFGLAGTNAVDDLEVIPFFQPDREPFLEYDVAKLLYTLAHPDKPVVALLSTLAMTAGFDPATRQARQPWVISTQMEQLFEFRNLDASTTSIDDDGQGGRQPRRHQADQERSYRPGVRRRGQAPLDPQPVRRRPQAPRRDRRAGAGIRAGPAPGPERG